MTTSSTRALSRIVLPVVLVGLAGCAQMRRNAAAYDGRQLAAAGFSIQSLDPAEASSAPPLKVVEGRADGRVVYRYVDPYHCRCVYVGDAQAYAKYEIIADDDYVETLLSIPVD